MYVCNCNGLTESQVRQMVCSRGKCSSADIFRCLSSKPQCGKCVREIREMIDEVTAQPAQIIPMPLDVTAMDTTALAASA